MRKSRRTIHGLDWIHGRRGDTSKGERIWHAELHGTYIEVEYRRADYAYGEDPGWYMYSKQLSIFGKYLARELDEALEGATHIVFGISKAN